MKDIFITFVAIFLPPVVCAEEFECPEHSYKLSVLKEGFEHINHTITLNDSISIQELEDEMWFVEDVSCISDGFEITASHIQYNDPAKKVFTVRATAKGNYTIE